MSKYSETDNLRGRLIPTSIPSKPEESNIANNTIYLNILMTKNQINLNSNILNRINTTLHSYLNNWGKDYSGNWDYYSGDILGKYDTRIKSLGTAPSQFSSAQKLSDKITQQLDEIKIYTPKFIQNVQNFYTDLAKTEGFTSNWDTAFMDKLGAYSDSNLINLKTSPLSEVVKNIFENTYQYIPTMANNPDFKKNLTASLGVSDFNFNSPHQSIKTSKLKSLKTLRQRLFNKATCTLQTLPKKESDAMQDNWLKERFDYKPGEKTPDGTTVTEKAHSRRRIFFNTPVFKINNTAQWAQRYEDSKQTMISSGAAKNAYEDLDLIHGTAKWCVANIVGRDQGWFMGVELSSSGKMIGAGAYFGYKLGKSTVYAGDKPYSNIGHYTFTDEDDSANGIIILAKGMRGDNAKQRYKDIRNYTSKYGVGTVKDMKFTSVSSDQESSGLNDYEIAIKRNENILPEYFVDVSCRQLFDNVAVDANGNYYEYNPDYKAVADAQKDYYDRKKAGLLKPGEQKPADWDGSGYTPKWDKNGRLINMDSLTD